MAGDFSGVRVYPNPWRADRHSGNELVTIDGLPIGSTVKIFTVSGHWVKDLTVTVDKAPWDLKNNAGDKVASGIYLYLIKDSSGDMKKGQVVIIR